MLCMVRRHQLCGGLHPIPVFPVRDQLTRPRHQPGCGGSGGMWRQWNCWGRLPSSAVESLLCSINYKHREINCRGCHCVSWPSKKNPQTTLACSCCSPFHSVPSRPIRLREKWGQNNTFCLLTQSTTHLCHKIILPYNTIKRYHAYYSAL